VIEDAISLFRRACGMTGPLCMRVEGPGPGEVAWRACPLPFAVVGADPRADLTLDHPGVDRAHAYLQVVAGRVHWVDLGSRSGVLRGGRRGPSGWLERGRAIGVGPYALRPEGPGLPVGPADPDPAGPPDPLGPETAALDGLPTAALAFENSKGGPRVWRLGRELTLVGRARACKIRLLDPDVSWYHCALIRTPLGVWVVDLLARDGVRVDGRAVRSARLDDGVSLQLGRYRCRLRYGTPPAAAGRIVALPPPPAPPPAGPRLAPRLGSARRTGWAEPAPVATLEALTAHLMDPYGRLRQDPSQEFYRALRLMAELIGSMRPGPAGRFREELGRLDRLTRELQALQADSARRLPAPPVPAPAPSPSPAAPPAPAPALAPAPARPGAAAWRRPPPPPPPLGRVEADAPAWLTRRIEQIQEERQRLWQAMLRALRDDGPGLAIS